MNNFFIYIFFDIHNRNSRNKISEKCKDYGLSKIQYYLFSGYLNKKQISQIKSDILAIVGDKKIMLLILPICEKCMNNFFILNTKRIFRKKATTLKDNKIEFGMKLNRKFLDFEE